MNASQVNEANSLYDSPETVTYPVMVSTRVLAGALAIMCWDILNNLNNEYRLLFKYRLSLPTLALVGLGYMVTAALAETTPIGTLIRRCEGLELAASWMYVVCISTTSLLFLFRVRAVWNRNKYVIWFFSFMWLGVFGALFAAPQAMFATSTDSTRYCTSRRAKPFAMAFVIIPLVNDTLVFIAVTVGFVMSTHPEPTLQEGIRTVMYGDYLPAFSRAMLKDNQMYYLATVGCNLLTVVMFYIKSLPGGYRTMFVVPNVMLMNIMACRVYRNTKFGNQWVESTISIIPITFQEPNSSATRALDILSDTGNRAGGSGFVKAGRLENGELIGTYSSHKTLSDMQEG
ncbi:hypothetical protein M413DRAFT_31763 [Hebeloma cylindrosporum]|uniref:Uncharacterized protein n=1 Tax=Hebeloma cylindrosporum TaxID=76867 RepID=A0A0C3BHZ2_HEBCY|nr:hypothetical protein M413DRAFT_31763 [Hebeloma cylindrosporum h7]